MTKNRKATKKFQQKRLKRTIENRRKIQKFKKSIERRQFKRKLSNIEKEKKDDKDIELSKKVQKLDDSDDDLISEELNEMNDLALSDEESSEDEGDIENFQTSDEDEENSDVTKKSEDYSSEDQDEENSIDNEESGSDDEESSSENEDLNDLNMDVDEEEEKEALEEAGLDYSGNERTPNLTSEMIDKWMLAITEGKSLRSTQRLVLAFRAASHINEDEAVQSLAYKISDPSVFNSLVVVCLKHVPNVFHHHLDVKDSNATNLKSIHTHRKWKSMQTLVKSFLNSVLYMLKQLTESDTLYFIIKEAEKLVPYYSCFPKVADQYLKVLLQHWGTAEDKVRVVSFINIRRLALASPPFIDLCLKGIYMTFVRCCKETSVFTIPSINLMSNCAVEIYGLDFKNSYQSAFGYIRQLAIHLRNSMNTKSNETFNAVYNWQYIHCLKLWSEVLAKYCDEQRVMTTGKNSLQELIYPLVQVCIGVIRLNSSAQYFPLQFHCMRALVHLMQKTGTFIPLAPYLFEILHSAEMCRNAKPSTLKPLDFTIHLKAPKNYLRTTVYQEGICEELTELLLEYYASFCLSIAYPELIIPAVIQIKRFIKDSKRFKINKQLQQLVQKLEENGKFIEQHRQHVNFGPGDIEKAKSFLRDVSFDSTPLGAYAKTYRKLKEQQRKLMETEQDN